MNRNSRQSALWPVLTVVTGLVLGGCASTPPERFYSLSSGMGYWPVAAVPAGFYIELPAVTVPPQVARSQLVVNSGVDRVELLEQERWSAPLAAEIGLALSLAVSGELGTIDVARTPVQDGMPVYRITANVQRFESVPGRHALADVVWSVRRRGGTEVRTCRSVAREAVGPGYEALVAGHRRAMASVAAGIAHTLRGQAAGGGIGACPATDISRW